MGLNPGTASNLLCDYEQISIPFWSQFLKDPSSSGFYYYKMKDFMQLLSWRLLGLGVSTLILSLSLCFPHPPMCDLFLSLSFSLFLFSPPFFLFSLYGILYCFLFVSLTYFLPLSPLWLFFLFFLSLSLCPTLNPRKCIWLNSSQPKIALILPECCWLVEVEMRSLWRPQEAQMPHPSPKKCSQS